VLAEGQGTRRPIAKRFTPSAIFGGKLYAWRLGSGSTLFFQTGATGELEEIVAYRENGEQTRFGRDGSQVVYQPGGVDPKVVQAPNRDGGFDCDEIAASFDSMSSECVKSVCRWFNCWYFGECGGRSLLDHQTAARAVCIGNLTEACRPGVICCTNCEE
jgi:hypothetical protein